MARQRRRPRLDANNNAVESTVVSSTRRMLLDMDQNMNAEEKTFLSFVGTALTVSVLYTLAMSSGGADGEDSVAAFTDNYNVAVRGPAALEALEVASLNIFDAALPSTASDVVSVAAGEAMAGLIGAASSFGIARASSSSMAPTAFSSPSSSSSSSSSSKRGITSTSSAAATSTIKVSDAVADGDFLLTAAAAKQLLGAFGVSPFLASLAATALAIVPYSFVKVGARRRELEQQEARLMDQLLAEEQERNRRSLIPMGQLNMVFGGEIMPWNQPMSSPVAVDPKLLTPITDEKPKLDMVETFADVAKWLAFDVLRSDFGGHLMWQGQVLFPGVESAVIGLVTGLTTQVYSDVLYANFGLGGDDKRNQIRSRTVRETTAAYLSKMIYCAVLFGVYDTVKIPAKFAVAALSSGGIDACVGSNNYSSCVATFVTNNPLGASPEAELRSLVTAMVSLWNNYGVPSLTFS